MKQPLAYFPRITLSGGNGQVIRRIHADAARAMVAAGTAAPVPSNGRIREVLLVTPASTHAARVGEPSQPRLGGTKFTKWTHLEESGARCWEHHPRCLIVL
jgi:hypothetical protein